MTTEQWNKIESIVDEALECDPEDRKMLINEKCAGDPDLLHHVTSFLESINEADRFFTTSISVKDKLEYEAAASEVYNADYESFLGSTIGAYTLSELLGEGGMGAVFLGKRTDGQFEHTAAIKIIQSGLNRPDIYDHFLRERQILAGLNHENIARLYDGGVTENNIPYLIMEYVDGTPIDIYCDKYNLTINDRIQLFRSVCDAARYAHRNLVIHRDLKPENILIKQNGTVKVMDFGIAKLLDNSQPDNSIDVYKSGYMSLSSASPEQIKQQPATTASDVYALGILLYNLLVGVHPYPKENSSFKELILTHEPASLSERFEQLPSNRKKEILKKRSVKERIGSGFLNKDLNAISQKCLNKRADDRYQSVDDLLDDLNRYESHLPVNARMAGSFYRAGKFFRRNRGPLSVAVSMLLIILLSGFFYTYTVQQERDLAQLEANKATQVTQFVLDLFKGSDPSQNGGNNISARELLDRGIDRTEYLSNQPEIQASMLEVLGRILTQLGDYSSANELIQKSIDLRLDVFGEESLETVSSYEQMGILLSAQGDLFQAQSVLEDALVMRDRLQGNSQSAISEATSELAYVYRRLGKFDEAEKIYRSLINTYENELGPEDPLTLSSLSSLGVTLHTSGRLDEAESIYRDVLKKRLEIYNTAHPDIAMSYNNLGSLLLNLGQFEESEAMLKNALQMRQTLFGESHPKIALTMNNLGILNRNTGRFEEAISLISESMTINRELFGKDELQTATNLFSLAELYMMTGKYEQAYDHYRQSNQIFRDHLPDESSFIARSLIGMGESKLYESEADLKLIRNQITVGFNRVKEIHPEKSIEYGLASAAMGRMLLTFDQSELGINYLEEAYTIVSDIEGANSVRAAAIESLLTETYSDLLPASVNK